MIKKIFLLFVTPLISFNSYSSVKLVIAPSTEYIAFYKKDINQYLAIRKEGFRTDIELNHPDVSKSIYEQMYFIDTNIKKNHLFTNSKKAICRIGFSTAKTSISDLKTEIVSVKELADNSSKTCNDIERYLKELSKQHSELKYVKAAKAKNIFGYDIFYIVY